MAKEQTYGAALEAIQKKFGVFPRGNNSYDVVLNGRRRYIGSKDPWNAAQDEREQAAQKIRTAEYLEQIARYLDAVAAVPRARGGRVMDPAAFEAQVDRLERKWRRDLQRNPDTFWTIRKVTPAYRELANRKVFRLSPWHNNEWRVDPLNRVRSARRLARSFRF